MLGLLRFRVWNDNFCSPLTLIAKFWPHTVSKYCMLCLVSTGPNAVETADTQPTSVDPVAAAPGRLNVGTLWHVWSVCVAKNSCYMTKTVIFTVLHGMQTRSSDENSVRPSVSPSVYVRVSVWQTRDLWQNGRKIGLDFYTIRKII